MLCLQPLFIVSKTSHMIYENHILKEMLGVERRRRGQAEIWLMSKIGLELLQGIHHLNY